MSDRDDGPGIQIATLGGGCFWCVEAVFQELQGVDHVESGYSGGATPDPSYEQVCLGTTGHAEVVQVHFDPEVITYREILRIFFATHDPTTPNQQGADIGTQYRSAVYYGSPEQRRVAEEVVDELEAEGVFDAPIVTEITELGEFWVAEDYHQDYYRRNPQQGYCRVVIDPKVAKVRASFADRLRTD